MPSPSIPPSRSVPDVAGLQESHCSPPGGSSLSSDLPIKIWPKKLGEVIARKGGSSKKNPQLTEGSLKAFNEENGDKRYAYSSPYYRGLTDFSLVISRQKASINPEGTYAPSIISSTSSRSSFVSRVHEWSTSCFSPRSREHIPSSGSTRTKNNVVVTTMNDCIRRTDQELEDEGIKPGPTSLESSKTKVKVRPDTPFRTTDVNLEVDHNESPVTYANELNSFRAQDSFPLNEDVDIEIEDDKFVLSKEKKPLREKESEAPQLLPQSPAPARAPARAPAPPPEPESASKELLTLFSPYPSKLGSSLPPIQSTESPEKVTNNETCKPHNERIFVWADNYRPSYLKDFLCNRSKALELQDMARKRECSHFIFEGSPGVGKRTMISALLHEIFDAKNLQATVERKEFHLKGESVGSIFANVKTSYNHVEVNLSELRGYEKQVIVQLMNERTNNGQPCSYDNCRAIVLLGADKLSTDAMVYIKWLLERYRGCNKMFFCCSDASKLEPVKPICKVVQLLRPSIEEIVDVLNFIAEKEGINMPHQLALTIANNSKNNLRQAIRSFEATTAHFNSSLQEGQEILTGWEDVIANVAANIIEEQSPRQLYTVRGKLQNLIEHNVSPEFIFTMLVDELKNKVGEELQQQIDKIYSKYNAHDEDHNKRDDDPVTKTIQQFMKIEEFIAKFMSWYKSSVLARVPKMHEVESVDMSVGSRIT